MVKYTKGEERMKRSEIVLKNLQIKSVEKFRTLAGNLEEIEIECGIKHVKITLENMFVCGDIEENDVVPQTPMEQLLKDLIWSES